MLPLLIHAGLALPLQGHLEMWKMFLVVPRLGEGSALVFSA